MYLFYSHMHKKEETTDLYMQALALGVERTTKCVSIRQLQLDAGRQG